MIVRLKTLLVCSMCRYQNILLNSIIQIDYFKLKIFKTLVIPRALDVGQWTTADDSADFF